MALLRSPDGSETMEVSDPAEVRRYVRLGATVVQAAPAPPPVAAAPASSAAPEPGTIATLPQVPSVIARILAGGLSPGGSIPYLAPDIGQAEIGNTDAAARLKALDTVGNLEGLFLGPAAAKGAVREGVPILGRAMASGGGLANRITRAPFVRHIPFAKNARGMTADIAQVGEKLAAMGARAEAPAAAAAADVQPIVGRAEAEAFRKGGQTALDAERQAAKEASDAGRRLAQHRIEKQAAKAAEKVPSVEKRIAASKEAAKPHEVQYYSESRGEHVNIEDMNQKHIEHAVRKLAAKNPKPGSVARRQLDALLAESKKRMAEGGIHIGQAEESKRVIPYEEAVKYRPWLKRAAGK